MKEWRNHWRKWLGRYQALPRRQQMLMAACMMLAPYFVASTFWLDPALARAKQLQREVDGQRSQTATLSAQLQNLRTQISVDPDAPQKAKIAELDQQIASLDKEFGQLQDTLISPAQMVGFLESLLIKAPSLRLVSLKTLPPGSIMPTPEQKKEAEQTSSFDLYRHGVEIRLEGGYNDLSRYLEQLEKSQKKVLWGGLQIQAGDYPVSTMTLMVYTLSTDKAWISL